MRKRHHAATRRFDALLAIGVVMAAAGGLLVFAGMLVGAAYVVLGAGVAWLALRARRRAATVPLINSALNLLTQGRLAEAEALLAEADAMGIHGPNRRAAATQRAI